MKNIKKKLKSINIWLIRHWYIVIIALLILLLGKNLITFITLATMIIAASFISLYRKILPLNLGLELITFIVIVVSFAINPFVAWLCAIIIIIASHFLNHNFCFFILIKIIVYGIVSLTALFLTPTLTAAMILVILKNIIFWTITFSMNPAKAWMDTPSNLINIAFNYYLFSRFAEFFIGLI